MTIAPGRMNDRITLQKRTMLTVNEPYQHQVEGFADIATVWAQYRPTGGREFREGSADVGEERATFSIHYREDLAQVDRLIFQGRVWDIQHVARVGWKQGLDINATSTGTAP